MSACIIALSHKQTLGKSVKYHSILCYLVMWILKLIFCYSYVHQRLILFVLPVYEEENALSDYGRWCVTGYSKGLMHILLDSHCGA